MDKFNSPRLRSTKYSAVWVHLLSACGLVMLLGLSSVPLCADSALLDPRNNPDEEKVEIVSGEDRTIYEYRLNGLLVAIKVVPKVGRPYYMVPADNLGSSRSLEHARHLYPQWVIVEW